MINWWASSHDLELNVALDQFTNKDINPLIRFQVIRQVCVDKFPEGGRDMRSAECLSILSSVSMLLLGSPLCKTSDVLKMENTVHNVQLISLCLGVSCLRWTRILFHLCSVIKIQMRGAIKETRGCSRGNRDGNNSICSLLKAEICSGYGRRKEKADLKE